MEQAGISEKIAKKNELIQICIIYRYISLAISTFVYFFMYDWEITIIRFCIATGMIFASIIGAYLYKSNFTEGVKSGLIITLCLEIVTYGLFIIFSGGLFSPYLWYFISSLIIVMAAVRSDKRFRVVGPLSVAWIFTCALTGTRYGLSPAYLAHSGINTGVAFLMVAGGFYTMFVYVGKLDKSQKELNDLNQRLKSETTRSEQALRHTMDIYEAFNLFSITDPGKVMDELTALLYRTIAPDGCLLLKMDLLKEIENIGSRGLAENHQAALLAHVTELELTYPKALWPNRIDVLGARYAIHYINNPSGIQGMLIKPFREAENYGESNKAQELFYLNLVGIIMQELDLQAMVESYIISVEQNRIANEIHDTVIQKLFAIACSLRLLDEQQEDIATDENSRQLRYIIQAVESTMRELREAIYGLRWEAEEQDEFADKLSIYMDEIKNLSGAAVNLMLDKDMQFITANQKTTFYRIICEAVNNAIRHGQASEIDIQVKLDGPQLLAEICDNGRGFDQHQTPTGGQGLINMYRITHLLKGQLSIESQVGKGTTIKCSLPKINM